MLRIPCELESFILDAVRAVVWRLLVCKDQLATSVVIETDDVRVPLVVLIDMLGSGVVLIDRDCFELVGS